MERCPLNNTLIFPNTGAKVHLKLSVYGKSGGAECKTDQPDIDISGTEAVYSAYIRRIV